MKKEKRSFTLSYEADQLLNLIAKKLGISKTDVLELAIRDKAAKEQVTLTETKGHATDNS